MRDFFGPKGLFFKRLPGFEYRPQQERLAKGILRVLQSGKGSLLAADAPPGVGKTFAFLAPALDWIREEGGSLLVLTSSITLQEQLISKDLPALEDILGYAFSFGLLKGRGNYLCYRKAMELGREGYLSFGDEGEASKLILAWLATTEDGDLSKLPLPQSHRALSMISGSFRGCLGPRCPYRDECFIQKALKNAAKWQVLVANYHLFFAYAFSHGGFPFSYSAVLCDEAHNMPSAASSVSTVRASKEDWERHLKRMPSPKITVQEEKILGYSQEEQLMKVKDAGKGAAEFFDTLDGLGQAEGLFIKIPDYVKTLGKNLLDMAEPLLKTGKKIKEHCDSDKTLDEGRSKDFAEYLAWIQTLGEMTQALRWCIEVSDYPEWTYWREKGALMSSPSRCSSLIPKAFGGPEAPPMAALSGTMAVGKSFSYWSRETGLDATETLVLDTPFDLLSHMEIDVVDLGVPVTHEDYDSRVCRVVLKLCLENGGRTLILLASSRLLKKVGSYLKSNVKSYNVYVQGDLPKAQLLEAFRDDETSILAGTVSFREGVDVPGNSLTQVIVDRIPFPHPNDPAQLARKDLEGKEYFMDSVLPGAKMNLRQGMGRLIRSCSDRGKVVILDGRVLSKKNWSITESLPKVPIKLIRVVDKAVAPG